jgi:hypothetical protein
VRLALAALAAALAAGCRVVDAKAWNLAQLHDANGRHRYTGAIEGNFEYYLRHVVAPSLTGGLATFEAKAPSAVEDPSTVCLENMIELEGYRSEDPRNRGIQVEWFSRLAVADPSKLSRERAVLALGREGERLKAGNAEPFPKDATATGPEALSEALAGLVRASRPVLEKGGGAGETELLDLKSACQVIRDLPLDLDGARRMLHASIDVGTALGFGRKGTAEVESLCEDLERRCIRYGIAGGLKDPDPLVRGAGVEAAVACVGPIVFDPILRQLVTEPSADVVLRVLGLVKRYGLADKPPPGVDVAPEVARRARWSAIYRLLERPESSVRVAAMLALEKVTGAGVHSLREEDWQSWWVAQRKAVEESAPEKQGP